MPFSGNAVTVDAHPEDRTISVPPAPRTYTFENAYRTTDKSSSMGCFVKSSFHPCIFCERFEMEWQIPDNQDRQPKRKQKSRRPSSRGARSDLQTSTATRFLVCRLKNLLSALFYEYDSFEFRLIPNAKLNNVNTRSIRIEFDIQSNFLSLSLHGFGPHNLAE